MSKFYYFIEDLDVTNDNIPDGVLIRQFKIDFKNNSYIYKKNNYISKEVLEKIIENIHNSFKKSELKFNSNIKLKNPVLFDIQAVQWWNNNGREQKQGENKWSSLSHKGPYFTHIMEPYIPLGLSIKYDGTNRNAKGTIIQLVYGENGFNQASQSEIKFNIINMIRKIGIPLLAVTASAIAYENYT
mgnify:CR=1 FL=1